MKYLGYMCKNARTVAKELSAPLFVQIMRAAISFSHFVFVLFAQLPPVASRYLPTVGVSDSCIAAPKIEKSFF